MNRNTIHHRVSQSTYALLVRSQENDRSLFETIAYGVCILCGVVAIAQFALQPVNLPHYPMSQTLCANQTTITAGS